jgi:hypothetical protein
MPKQPVEPDGVGPEDATAASEGDDPGSGDLIERVAEVVRDVWQDGEGDPHDPVRRRRRFRLE